MAVEFTKSNRRKLCFNLLGEAIKTQNLLRSSKGTYGIEKLKYTQSVAKNIDFGKRNSFFRARTLSRVEIHVVDHFLDSGHEAVAHVVGSAVLEALLAVRVRAQPQQGRERGRRVRRGQQPRQQQSAAQPHTQKHFLAHRLKINQTTNIINLKDSSWYHQ